MCGIVGLLSINETPIEIQYIKNMADKIAHRGPDDAGYLCFNTARGKKKKSNFKNLTDTHFRNKGLKLPAIDTNLVQRELRSKNYDLFMGHRRLSILDLSFAGHQPMSDLSKNVWISYNGEIYNFKKIKLILEKKGYKFVSQTDTEVIIYAYKEWGIECVKKFNGMFAFSLYDNKKKKFYLCRDRYGIKPIYYHITNNKTLIYGSEIKSILEYKHCKFELDKEALVEYFTFQNIFTQKTLHKNIKILDQGNYIEVDLVSKNIKKIQFWDFNFTAPETVKDEREYVEETNRLFLQAVNRQLISDVPVGSYLSGGIDSGSITAVASNHFQKSNKYLKTFTIGFDISSANGLERSFDERAMSEHISYKFKTEHYEMVLKSGDMERCFKNFCYHLEEPRVGQSYPNYYASKLASKFVKVILSGTGSDELFGGYPWRYFRTTSTNDKTDFIDNYYKFWQRLIPNKDIKKIFSPIFSEKNIVWTKDIFNNVFDNINIINDKYDFINRSLYFEAKTFLHGLLVVEDKLSMAHSLETRVPFLDNDLVDFAQKIPTKYKLRDLNKLIPTDENEIGKLQKTNDGKLILRKAMSKYLPKEIYKAVKQGFSAPDQSWFKGESIDFVKSNLLKNNAKIYNYLDKKSLKKLIYEHLDGKKNRRLLIWSLLYVENWLKQNNFH